MNLNINGILKHSSVNGPGVRFCVFTQGCSHHCFNCQNKNTWEPNCGTNIDVEELSNEIKQTKFIDGVTLSGGDPLEQLTPVLELCKKLKEDNINIWLYTGYTFEEIKNSNMIEVLPYVDVIVDGRYDEKLKSSNLIFRGSSNQKIIDIQKTLKSKKIIEFDEGEIRV